MAAGLDFPEKIEKYTANLNSMEEMLGNGLVQPFNGANSGARKLMFNVHHTHCFPLLNPEKPIIETGYENRFGDYSSSIIKAHDDYKVIAKVSKFSFAPNHHYWLFIENLRTHELDVVERVSYQYVTESYGYLYNNEYMDNLEVGETIKNGQVIQKSLAYDEYNNRADGVNFNIAYLALDDNMEDSIVFSDAAAGRLTAPLIKPVEIMINDNDIPLNLYGNGDTYKIIPDIGEEIKDANLIALRKERKEEAYFTQSINNLNSIMISDDKKQVIGRVIDVDIFCNNVDILDSHYYAQLKMYYNELHRQAMEIVQILLPYASQNYKMSYDLEKLFAENKRIVNNTAYIDKRTFSNIILRVTVLEEKKMEAGDKASNRYGGKGVVSTIWPQKFMPRFKNANNEWEYVDVIFNSSTMINRENVGQTFELSLTHIGCSIIGEIIKNKLSVDEAYNMIHKFVSMCSPEQAAYMEEVRESIDKDEFAYWIDSIISSGSIHLSIKPLSEPMTLDKLNEIYKVFPFVKQNVIEVALAKSNGEPRYIKARRPIVIGKEYIYRLKQFAEEKFSATSLSATNIRNENTKSKVKKDFRELYPNTPIKFGNMETNNFAHIGVDALIANMMIHSLSPQGRRLVEQMYTGDPFNIDIKLDSDSRNRSAEIANTYLKTIGRRLNFIKVPRKISHISMSPVTFNKDPFRRPISFVSPEAKDTFDYQKDFDERMALDNAKKRKKKIYYPVRFDGRDIKRKERMIKELNPDIDN